MSEAAVLLTIALLLSRKFDPGRLDPEVQWLCRMSGFHACQEGRFPPPEPAVTLEILREWAPALQPAQLDYEEQQALLPLMMDLALARHPDAPDAQPPVVIAPQRHAAFVNVLYYALTGWSGGYGGPSMREHWASCHLHPAGQSGMRPFDWLLQEAERICYGPLTLEAARMLAYEQCFDDAPGDYEEAVRLLEEAGEAHLLYDDDDLDFLADMYGMPGEDFPPEDDI